MNIDFTKGNGLVPVIVQDEATLQVLMLGYMNEAALKATRQTGKVTFYSRSRMALWTKGETSGNYLQVKDIRVDCDQDTLLITAIPLGPVCHTGSTSCFGEDSAKGFVYQLEKIIANRIADANEQSYTSRLFQKGMNAIAQKVGEEAVELIIESKDQDDERFRNEATDLLYHFLVLLRAKDIDLSQVEEVLKKRNRGSSSG
ncbi:MAG: bifunctional phosphoribosyl-AMP cyclohydrolase/phosphoribosyl-ATP diphosphatase HisIE [Saprospiraceae bacterium]|nr:bifunctional phosphoribosyl-AMP cyclohydrolase/phosphoribosyl-ATP diphosphatase HisIE [Candidatus Opimibacter skivensis]